MKKKHLRIRACVFVATIFVLAVVAATAAEKRYTLKGAGGAVGGRLHNAHRVTKVGE